jgi:hypothetical protein
MLQCAKSVIAKDACLSARRFALLRKSDHCVWGGQGRVPIPTRVSQRLLVPGGSITCITPSAHLSSVQQRSATDANFMVITIDLDRRALSR